MVWCVYTLLMPEFFLIVSRTPERPRVIVQRFGMGFFSVKQSRNYSRTWKHIYVDVIMNFNPHMFMYCKFAVSGLQNQNSQN